MILFVLLFINRLQVNQLFLKAVLLDSKSIDLKVEMVFH